MTRGLARVAVRPLRAPVPPRVERKRGSWMSYDPKSRAATGRCSGEVAVSDPDDASERDADRMAEQALSGAAVAPVLPLVSGGPRLQRAVDEQAAAQPGGFIVDDEAAVLLSGQMRKSEFLRTLRAAACAAADRELARVGRDTEGCPYLARWFDYYEQRDARQVERALRKYAPAAAQATSAAGYIPIVSARAAQAARQWAQTGALPELPEGMGAELMGGGLVGAIGGAIGAIGGAIGGALSAIGSLFFKAESGGARGGVDRGALESRLGSGQPLDGSAQARMGAAFGYDFSRVRVHADHHAAHAASGLNARAFTLGNHVAFAAGQYRPGQPVGDALLAHELAHVVQQGGAVAPSAAAEPSPALEEDADTAAASAVIGLWSPARAREQVRERKPRLRSGLRLQRCNQQRMPSNIGVARPPSEAMAEVPAKAKTPPRPPLEGFAAAFPDAAALIKQSPSALAFVKQAEASGALFGGYTEDEGKIWPFTRQRTVFIPRSQTDPVEAMSSFLFELNNAVRASQFADIIRLADRGKLDAKKYARLTVAVEVEGTLALAELWVKMKTEIKGDYSKRDKDFYLSGYNEYKAGRLSKDQLIDMTLQEPSGEDPSKTTEMYYMDKYFEMQKLR